MLDNLYIFYWKGELRLCHDYYFQFENRDSLNFIIE